MKKILIIDDEEKLRTLMARIITLEGFDVLQAADCKSGLSKLNDSIDLVLCDVKLPDGHGVELTLKIKRQYPTIEVILLTAYGNIPDGVQAIKNGAFDYIVKGDDNNKIIPLIHRALEKAELTEKVSKLQEQLGKKFSFDGILGTTIRTKDSIELARKVAPTDATVLLVGETGTGKEVFANAIHQNSIRKNKNFVAINCSAISHELLESEMFGHIAGAFTGAVKDKKGLFEEANGGTLFLDEIGEMPQELQAKMLRVLESGEYNKVGSSKPSVANVRLIAATNRDLNSEIANGRFRQDLYYRLSAFVIALPALRERSGDIEMLAAYFMKLYNDKTNKKITGIDPNALQLLKKYQWPGNIRELRNVIERGVILTSGTVLEADSLPVELHLQANRSQSEGKILSAFSMASAEMLHIQKVLNHTKGNKAEAARLLDIGIATLYRKMDEYKMK